MSFEHIIGHRENCALLEREAQAPSHAYLFVGTPNTGKATIALAFAALIVGGGERSRDRVLRRLHPDVVVVGPEGNANLGVEQARSAISAAGRHPVESDRKVFIFAEGSLMTEAAANALLKTLEEPSDTTVLIIVADSEDDLPITVASRCRTVRFGRVPDQVLTDALVGQGLAPEQAVEVARISGGRPGMALAFANRPEVGEFRQHWLSIPDRVSSQPGEAFRLAEQMLQASAPLLDALEKSQQREIELAEERGSGVPQSLLDSHKRARNRADAWLIAAGLEMLASWYMDVVAAQNGAPVRNPNLDRAALARVRLTTAVRSAEQVLDAVTQLRAHQRPLLVLTWLFASLGEDT